MKIIECVQGSDQWHMARLGLPTASEFGRLVTPTGKPSAQADAYLHRLVAERLIGMPVDNDTDSPWMTRGSAMEAEAVAFYELQRGEDTRAVGFVTTDDGLAGASPDRLVGDDGLLEIKCPSAAVHVGYLLEVEPRKYWPQLQGQLWVTGRAWVDFLSYCPGLPPALVRYARDEEFIAKLAEAVPAFACSVEASYLRLAEMIGQRRTA